MKRSKIFLGVTSILLATAGLAATKMYHSVKIKLYYGTLFDNVNHRIFPTRCPQLPFLDRCTANGTGLRCTYQPTDGFGGIIGTYLLYTDPACTVPALYDTN